MQSNDYPHQMADPDEGYGYTEEVIDEPYNDGEMDYVEPIQASYSDGVVPQEEFHEEPAAESAAAQDYEAQDQFPPPTRPLKKQVSISDTIDIAEDPGSSPIVGSNSELSSDPSRVDKPTRRQSKADEIRAMRMRRASQHPSQYTVGGNMKKKHCFILFMKSVGMVVFVVGTIFVLSYFILYGFGPQDEPEPEYEEPEYQIQQVLPGRLQGLSLSGTVAAIKDDYNIVQMWNHVGSPEAPFWKRMGQPFDVIGEVSLSGNGTIVAYIDTSDRRPHILGFDEEKNLWLERAAPLIIADELSMDVDATFLSVGVYNRLDIGGIWQDFIVSYAYDGSQWTEFANRLELGSILSFAMSPTARYIVANTLPDTKSNTTMLSTFRLSVESEDPQWAKVDTAEQTLDGQLSYSYAVAEEVFALASDDVLNVFSYSGRIWGQDLFPRDNSTFTSVALSVDGRTMAVGDISGDGMGIVNRYRFPWTADTGDDWEGTGPPLEYDWQLDEGYLRDEYGNEAPVFGTIIELSGDATTMAVQSGLEGNQNVHFYDVVPPSDEEDEEEE